MNIQLLFSNCTQLKLITIVGFLAMTSGQIIHADNKDMAKTICGACHGVNGVSIQATIPNLAGQKSGYIKQQVIAMRDGDRKNHQMIEVVKNLTDQQIVSLADYFSNQQSMKVGATEVNQQGRNIRSACISCHGIKGITVNEEWPNIAGQKKDYLQNQLMAFRDGSRYGPSMKVIANELTVDQIKAVAEYYSQVPAN